MDFKIGRKAIFWFLSLLLIVNSSLADDNSLADILTNLSENFVKEQLTGLKSINILTDLINKMIEEKLPDLKTAINNDLCYNHTILYFQHIFKGSFWALKMFDSSAKVPQSIMAGLIMHFGNYDECVDVVHVPPEVGNFQGQYCVVAFGVPEVFVTLFKKLLLKKSEYDKIGKLIEQHFDFLEGLSLSMAQLLMGYCIPSTCSAKNFQDGLNSLLSSPNLTIRINATVHEYSCDVKTEIPFKSEDWAALIFFMFIGLVIAAGTAYDLMAGGKKNELLLAFSLHTNGKRLFSTRLSHDSVECIHGLRFIGMCWIIFGHRLVQYVAYPDVNKIQLLHEMENWKNYYMSIPLLQVDTFLFLSGFLITLLFLRQMKNKKSGFNIPLYYLLRYVRLTPVYAVVILLQATLLRHIISGPFSKKIGEFLATECQEHWMKNLLYITNYGDESGCVGHGWYNSTDTQLYVLSPLLLLALWKLPKRWHVAILSTLVAAGFIVPFIISYTNELPVSALATFGKSALYWKKLYYPTHARFGPWVIGAAFAYYLSDPLNRRRNLSKLKVALLWTLAITSMVGAVESIYPFYQLDENYSNFTKSLYNGIYKNVWAFGIGITVTLCELGYGGLINSVLSWKFFRPFSKLTYCSYLLHLGLQFLEMVTHIGPLYTNVLGLYRAVIADIVITLGVSAVFSLCFESPIITIAHILTSKGSSTKERKNSAKEYKLLL